MLLYCIVHYDVCFIPLQLVLAAAFILHLFFYDRLTSATILIVNLFVAQFLHQVRGKTAADMQCS